MEKLDTDTISFSMRNSNKNNDNDISSETLIIIEEKKSRTKCNENCDFYCCIIPCFICVSILCCCNSIIVISGNKNDLRLCPDLFPDYCPNFFCCSYFCSWCNRKKEESSKQPSETLFVGDIDNCVTQNLQPDSH
jgi:hypothetical protein